MLYTVTDGYDEEGIMGYREEMHYYSFYNDGPDYWPSEPDDDQLIKELDNEVVEEVEEEWGAWLKEGERPVSND